MPTLGAADVGWATLTLCVWWALWSLADAYLLAHTPWSELVVLTLSVSIYGVVSCCEACCERRQRQRYARRAPSLPSEIELRGADEPDTALARHALVE